MSALNTLRSMYPEPVILYADYYNSHLRIMKDARRLGFKEQYKACCGHGGGAYNFDLLNICGNGGATSCDDPGEYVNWDGAHFTEAAYKVMTDSFINGSYCSPSFHYLLGKKLQLGWIQSMLVFLGFHELFVLHVYAKFVSVSWLLRWSYFDDVWFGGVFWLCVVG